MHNLPESLWDLSKKRQTEIAKIAFHERSDAALNAVVIGLKSMNHVCGFGLNRLSRLSVAWEKGITDFYNSGGMLYKPFPPEGAEGAGEVLCQVDDRFQDLSPRRRREIYAYLLDQRMEAQWNAALIGLDTVCRMFRFGEHRSEQLTRQWEYDIRDFYQDRDLQEARLRDWIEEIGFVYEDGRLQVYKTEEDTLVRKRTAERRLAQQEQEDCTQ